MSHANARCRSWMVALWAVATLGCSADLPSVAPEPWSSAQVVFVVPSSLSSEAFTRVSVTADNDGTPSSVVFTPWSTPPPLPPVILSTTSTTVNANPGDVLKLSVTAQDPQYGFLVFDWRATTGILGSPTQLNNTSTLDWTALSCVPLGVAPSIEVTIRNSLGGTERVVYQVNWQGPTCGHPPCAFRMQTNLLTQQADCTTDTPLFIPDRFTLDGASRQLTVVDPMGAHFQGAALRNRGTTANVRNVKLRAQGLVSDEGCDGGDSRLRGIFLLGAGGSITDSEISGIHRTWTDGTPRGCQEGSAIEVRNPNASSTVRVNVLRNRLSGYQKAGIVIIGRVDATVTGNTVTGEGASSSIAQAGVQLSDGATGRVSSNTISGHSYTGNTDVASGILVAGGPLYGLALCQSANIQSNTLTGNDVGINLSQGEADVSPPVTPTRIQVLNNTLRNDFVTNGYPYQAGISDLGGGNTISSNTLIGAGYSRATQPGVTFDVDVAAGSASQVVFLTSSVSAAAGACSGKLVVQSQDARGNLAQPVPRTFTLGASGPEGTVVRFYSNPDCTGPTITTLDLTTPQAEVGFYFKATQPGLHSLSVSNGSLSAAQGQIVSF